ncbi:MAG: hypothetical protein ACREIA_06205 [Opitutaceae bacterium]
MLLLPAAELRLTAANNIGWAEQDITPTGTVAIAGQMHMRVSEGVADPLTATVLALESDGEHVVWVSRDLVVIVDSLRDKVRSLVAGTPSLDPNKVILHATHSHAGLELDPKRVMPGISLGVMPIPILLDQTADLIAQAVIRAWNSRAPGGISYGLSHAVVGRNRRSVDRFGKSTMYGNIASRTSVISKDSRITRSAYSPPTILRARAHTKHRVGPGLETSLRNARPAKEQADGKRRRGRAQGGGAMAQPLRRGETKTRIRAVTQIRSMVR